MVSEYPPQKFCDKCGKPDLEYPYTSYTGQIAQVTRVTLSEEQSQSCWSGGGGQPSPDKVGIDLGDLCQQCRQDVYNWFMENFTDKWKDYPKKLDEYCTHFVTGENNEPSKPWWEKKIKIKGIDGKEIPNEA